MGFKDDIKRTVVRTKNWAELQWTIHRQEIIVAAPVVVSLTAAGINELSKNARRKADEHRRLLVDYDPSCGWYNELKRPLSQKDKEAILAYRELTGKNQTEALIYLGLLKK